MLNLLFGFNQPGSLVFGEACVYALIGFAVVFAGITLIIFIIWLIGLLMRKTNNFAFLTKGRKPKKKQEQATVTEVAEVESGDIPDEVKVAVIAAIMAYYSEEAPKCEFKVKRIKRI